MTDHQPLPVQGYTAQPQSAVDTVNVHKTQEELLLRMLDTYKEDPKLDQHWLAIARTHFEHAWMALNRAVFKPERITLSHDTPRNEP